MSLRRLEAYRFEVPLRPAKDCGERGSFEWLAPGQLVIDSRYQREVGQRGRQNIKQIVEHFEWAMFSPLIVAARGTDGLYAVIDGQHRAIAAISHGAIAALPCYVIAADQTQQAKAFAVINGQVTAVHPLAMFRAQVAAGAPRALAIVEAAAAAGVRILEKSVASARMAPGETQSANTIGQALARYGREATVAALNCVTKTGANPGMLIEAVIAAFAQVMYAAPKWRGDARLHEAIRDEGVRNLYMRALAAQTAGQGVSLRVYLVAAINAALAKRLGKTELRAQPKSPPEIAREREKRERGLSEHAAQNMALGRVLARGRAKAKMAGRQAKAEVKTAVDAFVASKGVRRFESGATGNITEMLEWLSRHGVPAARRTIGRGGPKGGRIYQIRGKLHDLPGLIAAVNAERKKRGLEPITA